jgi:hypothetical protein
MKTRDFRLPDNVEISLRELKVKGVPRRQIDAMRLANALRDHVSDTGKEVIHIENILDFAPNYDLTTMAVLRAVIVLRSYGQIGMSKFDGKLECVMPNPTLFASTAWVGGVADQQIVV